MKLRELCLGFEQTRPIENEQLLHEFNLLFGHPWSEVALSPTSNYYSCLNALAQSVNPRKVLEVGVAFGMSAAALIKACRPLELYVGIDLGRFGEQLDAPINNIEFAQSRIHLWCMKQGIPIEHAQFFEANTQPVGKGDNEDKFQDVPRWNETPELTTLLAENQFDLIFIDGKHTGDGLINDLKTFWPYLKPGGLAICDDLHDACEYEQQSFSWLGYTTSAFKGFIRDLADEIDEFVVWKYPQVIPEGKNGLRPFGLIRKAESAQTIKTFPTDQLFFEDFFKLSSEKEKISLPNGIKRVWIDVGANEGESTLPELESNPDLLVIAFEPLPDKYEKLLNKHERYIALPFAVSSVSGVSTFNRSANDVSSSLNEYNPPGLDAWGYHEQLQVVKQIKVRTVRLDSILTRLNISQIEFIKIDAQGCDLDVVRSIGEQLVRVKKLKLEVAVTPEQLYQGAATRQQAIEFMQAASFKLISHEEQSDGKEQNLTFENTGQPLSTELSETQEMREKRKRIIAFEAEHKEKLVQYALGLVKQNPQDIVAWTAIAILAWHYKDVEGFKTAYQNVSFLGAEKSELEQLEPYVKECLAPMVQEASELFLAGQKNLAKSKVDDIFLKFYASPAAIVQIANYYASTHQAEEFMSLPQRALQHKQSCSNRPNTQVIILEQQYLKSNPDIAQAIKQGGFRSGWEHYARFGHAEGRSFF